MRLTIRQKVQSIIFPIGNIRKFLTTHASPGLIPPDLTEKSPDASLRRLSTEDFTDGAATTRSSTFSAAYQQIPP